MSTESKYEDLVFDANAGPEELDQNSTQLNFGGGLEDPPRKHVVTLLKRGCLVPPPGASPQLILEMKSAVPRDYFMQMVKKYEIPKSPGDKVFVAKSATGSGKSITLPPSFLPYGRCIGLTEPTKASVEEIAFDLARRNPELEMGRNLGYQTGSVNKSIRVGINVMTPGILLQHVLTLKPLMFMRKYSVLMIDEVHRHDITGDFLLRALKLFIDRNWASPECPILIVMSATMTPAIYMGYFDTIHTIEVSGQAGLPITPHFLEVASANVVASIVAQCKTLKGDTLIFLPGAMMIEAVQTQLQGFASKTLPEVVPISSDIIERGAGEIKNLQFESKRQRFILATDAAETGITFPFLTNLIDSGYKLNVVFNPALNAKIMWIGAISQAAAIQRRGRVGRQTPGEWYPMYTKATYDALQPAGYPEVYIADMSDQVLRFALLITETDYSSQMEDVVAPATTSKFDPAELGLINPMSSEMLQHCMEKLYVLGMIDTNWTPTLSGWIASHLTILNVQEARLIISGIYHRTDLMHNIIIACAASVSGGKTVGVIPNTYNLVDGFLDLLVTYEQLMRKINITETLSITFVRDWCEEKKLNYFAWLNILTLIDDTVLQLLACGVQITTWGAPASLSDELDRKDYSSVGPLKNCIAEAYVLQSATFSSERKLYTTNSRGQPIKTKLKAEPMNIVCNSIDYRDGAFNAGSLVSSMDGYVALDPYFLY